MKQRLLFFAILFFSVSIYSCKKYLDEKANKRQFVPDTIEDLQALLDNSTINETNPVLSELVADNYYVTTPTWTSLLQFSPDNSLNYIWDQNTVPFDNSWNNVYQFSIYYSNIVLDQLSLINIPEGDNQRAGVVKGSALFLRSFSFYNLAQLFCRPYNNTANEDLGIVLRMTSDINALSTRATVQQTYDRIVADLLEAAELLPTKVSFPTRPTKAAAYGVLARTYLSMRDYINAGKYADLCLQQHSKLLDFNDLVPLSAPPIKTFNQEVIYHSIAQPALILASFSARIDSNLYASYSDDDLRKIIFFSPNTGDNLGTYSFQGSYHGNSDVSSIFDGITTGEMYLVRAECYARANNVYAAMADLNTLMEKRWRASDWVPFTAATADEARSLVLSERRKELVFRGQRWPDIRRLNLEDAAITMKRTINGTVYTLPPNDKRSVMLIPYDVVNRSGIAQNPR